MADPGQMDQPDASDEAASNNAPSPAPKDGGDASNRQAQKVVEALQQKLSEIMQNMEVILNALQKMGVPSDSLSKAAQAGDEFMSEVSEALGGGEVDEAKDQQEGEVDTEKQPSSGPVPMEAGNSGVPTM